MALTENSLVDKIEVVLSGHVQVRMATVILRDGEEISRSYNRHVLAPGDDLTGQDARVQAIAAAAWAPEVVAAYQAQKMAARGNV